MRSMRLSLCAVALVAAGAASLEKEQISAEVNKLKSALNPGMNQLLSYYNWTSGFFGINPQYFPYWTTGNQLETLCNYAAATGDVATVLPYLDNSFQKMTANYCNCWRDDVLWFVNMWARCYEVTGKVEYLAQSESLFADILGPWQAWNTSCGGINWENGDPYVNAITNELFLSAATKLDALTRSRSPVTNFTYAQWAEVEWSWFNQTAMYQPQQGIFQDGLSMQNCNEVNPTGAFWTYNQGVLLDGMTRLADASSNTTLSQSLRDFAWQIVTSAISYFSNGDESNIIRETSCGGPTGNCGGPDGTGRQFKGAFVRHLGYAAEGMASSVGAAQPHPERLAWLAAWGSNVTSSLLTKASNWTSSSSLQFGQMWQGPFATDPSPWVSQGCALDAILATITMLQAQLETMQ
jgi:predicted alpha-1,6-mannanase (GH76 family)